MAIAHRVRRVLLLALLAALAALLPGAAALRAASPPSGSVPVARIAVVLGGDVYLLDTAGGALTRLTTDGDNAAPSWSPSGDTLLFRNTAPGSTAKPWRWTPAGGVQPVDVSPEAAIALGGTVSATAQRFGQGGTGDRFDTPSYVTATIGGRSAPITPAESGVHWAPLAWSPDGSTLALQRSLLLPDTPLTKDATDVFHATLWLTVGGPLQGRRRPLPLPPSFANAPGIVDTAAWSPDGRFLTVGVGPATPCSSCRADGLPYYAVPVDGGRPIPLRTGLNGEVAWTHDGALVVQSSPLEARPGTLGRFFYTDKHLVRIDTATGAQRQLTADPTDADTEPAVSPDGGLVAAVRGRDPGGAVNGADALNALHITRRIVLVRTDDGGLRPLTAGRDGWADDSPAWTPDGGWVVFARYQLDGTAELWAASSIGDAERQLVTGVGPGGSSQDSIARTKRSFDEYFAVQPNPRLAALGSGGPPRQQPVAPFVVASAVLLTAGALALRRSHGVPGAA